MCVCVCVQCVCVLTQPIKHGREALKLYYRYLNIVSKREHKDIFLPSEDGGATDTGGASFFCYQLLPWQRRDAGT